MAKAETAQARSKELPTIVPVFISLPEKESDSLTAPIRTINATLSCLWEMHRWGASILSGNKIDNFSQAATYFSDFIETAFGYDDILGATREGILDNFSTGLSKKEKHEGTNIHISDIEELHVLWNGIKGAFHDMRRPISIIARESQSESPKKILKNKEYRDFLHHIVLQISTFPEILNNIYEKTPYDTKHIINMMYYEISDSLPRNILVKKDKHAWDASVGDALWDNQWCIRLAQNIAQNIERAFSDYPGKKEVIISAEEHFDENAVPVVDIIIDDTVPGFPKEIIANGFQKGLTHWNDPSIDGTGTGMEYHAKVLRKHYSGDLIAENHKGGGRLRIRLLNQTAWQELQAHYTRDPHGHIISLLQLATGWNFQKDRQANFANALFMMIINRPFINQSYALKELQGVLSRMRDSDWRKEYLPLVIERLQNL